MKRLAIALSAFVPATALAHPGHGVADPVTPWHYVGDHGWIAALAIAVIAAIALWRSQKR